MTKIIIYKDGSEIVVESLNSGTICSFTSPKEAAFGIIGTFVDPNVQTQITFPNKKTKGYSPLGETARKELRGYFNLLIAE